MVIEVWGGEYNYLRGSKAYCSWIMLLHNEHNKFPILVLTFILLYVYWEYIMYFHFTSFIYLK